jgi:hypothetical protein
MAAVLVAVCLVLGMGLVGSVSAQSAKETAGKPDSARVNEATACKSNEGDRKKACQFGYNTSLGPKAPNPPTSEHKNAMTSDQKKQCEKYKNKDNNRACRKGYYEGHYGSYFASAASSSENYRPFVDYGGTHQCGTGDNAVKTKFNFGCQGGKLEEEGEEISPILDMAYSIIRFLSAGVGILVVASIIYAGIQYSSSQGNPEATQAAKNRIQNALIGLVFYMFIFALVQFLVPGGLFAVGISPIPPDIVRLG